MKMSQALFIKKLEKIHGKKYSPIDLYESTHVKIKVQCDCGNIFTASPNKLLSGRGCSICGRKKTTEASKCTTADFSKYVHDVTSGEYILEGTYVDYYTKVDILHTTCGFRYSVRPSKFKHGNRCPDCARVSNTRNRTHTHAMFMEKVKLLKLNEDFIICGKYVNTDTLLSIQCRKCDHKYDILPNNLTSNLTKCPVCTTILPRKSKKVMLIEKLLLEKQFNFKTEIRFEECRNIRPLPFDFALLDINLLIEYDGEQHFKAINSVGGTSGQRKTAINDKIKNKFCINNEISLLRIPYTVSGLSITKIMSMLETFNDQSTDVLYNRIEEMGGIFIHKNIFLDKD